jgi:hypothetical protein
MIASIISFIISILSSGDVSLGAEISGYSLLILSIIMITFIVITKYITIFKGQITSISSILSIVFISGPFILIFAIIGFILYCLIYYKNRISNGQVSNDYYIFNLWCIIILLVQTFFLYNNLNTSDFELKGKMSSVSISILYLMSVILSIMSIILYVILKYYQTDGFTNINKIKQKSLIFNKFDHQYSSMRQLSSVHC